MLSRFRWIAFFALACLPLAAAAQTTHTFVVKNGKTARPALTIAPDQKLMLEAAKKMTERDYKQAEALYSKALAANGGNINAYLQRGLARRDLGNLQGMEADARQAITLANAKLAQDTNNANLYYQRSLGERLLRRFDEAEKDLRAAIRLSNKLEWNNDLKALELERRMVP